MRPVIGRFEPMVSSDRLLLSLAETGPGNRLETEEREWAGEAGGVDRPSVFALSDSVCPMIGQWVK